MATGHDKKQVTQGLHTLAVHRDNLAGNIQLAIDKFIDDFGIGVDDVTVVMEKLDLPEGQNNKVGAVYVQLELPEGL